MIRMTRLDDFDAIHRVINDAAVAYKGAIPADRWHDPYMPVEDLKGQIDEGVVFSCYEENGLVKGVMGIQDRGDVDLIRHAYVLTSERQKGIGSLLLKHLLTQTQKPVLIGTWKAAVWAIDFYRKHGFSMVTEDEKNTLLKTYWNIPDRQVETSVVMADELYFNRKTVQCEPS